MFSLICHWKKQLSKQSRPWWFETLFCSLWRRCNGQVEMHWNTFSYSFPKAPKLSPSMKTVSREKHNILAALKSGSAFWSPICLELFAGSRAEGLRLENGQGPGASAHDVMYLYGNAWGIHVQSSGFHEMGVATSTLVMEEANWSPGYCHVCFTTLDEPVIKRMAQTSKNETDFINPDLTTVWRFLTIMVLGEWLSNEPFPGTVCTTLVLLIIFDQWAIKFMGQTYMIRSILVSCMLSRLTINYPSVWYGI